MSLSTGKGHNGGYLPKVVGTPQQMENETLLEGLQNILDDYPDGSQILREMVQNAEDAGATCMKIMYDSRPIDPGKSLNISKYFKGPGICIYNDETFKDIDWRGIKKIGASFKRKLNEPLKVGRFGQGFKSVFHIADHVVILSGKKLLIIDPLKSEEKEDDCWSASVKDLSGDDSPNKTLTCFDGKFGFNSKIIFEDEPEYKGTLFWIPLREKSSLISPKVYTNENIDQLFKSFKREAPIIPLFLRHIKNLELSFVKTDRFSYCVELVEENVLEGNKEYEKVIREIEQRKSLPDTTIASVREVVVRTYPHAREDFTKDHWTIVQYLYGSSQMSQSMKLLSRDKGLSLSPCTGIAFCTKSNSVNKPSGHVFCFLPLPLSDRSITGLPVHVNGFFALEHNRCHVKFGCDQDQSDNSLLWNDGLIAEFLPQNYNHIICHFKKMCEKGGNTPDLVETFYKLIPDPDSVDPQWHPLLKSLYDILLKNTSFYTAQNGGKWIQIDESVADIFYGTTQNEHENVLQVLEMLLIDCGVNFVKLPENIKTVLTYMDHKPRSITPLLIRDKLRSSDCWQEYEIVQKLSILEFILSDKQYGELHGLNLLPLSDDEHTFSKFSNDTDDIYVLCDESLDLFPGFERRLVSKKNVPDRAWKELVEIAEKGLYHLKLVTNEVLPDMFLQIIKLHCKTEKGNIFTAETNQVLTRTWIENVWKYIHSRGIEDLRTFKNVPLFPLFEGEKPENVLNGQEQGESIAVKFFCLEGKYMTTEYENMPTLPAPVQKVIQLTGIQLFPPAQTIGFYFEDVIGKFIKLPTAENVVGCFEFSQSDILISEVSRKINSICTDEERASLARYLDDHYSAITPCSQDLFKKIQMFYQIDNIHYPEIVSWNDNKFTVYASGFPEGLSYPRSFLLPNRANLLTKFETIEVSKCQLISEIIQLMLKHTKYKSADKRKFMIYLKGQPTNILDVVLIKARDINFIPSDDGSYHCVNDLFDPTSGRLRDLFCGKKGVFPDEEFVNQNNLLTFLSQLGIKKERDITSKDLIEAAYEVGNANASENRECKAKALISFLVENPDSISKEGFEVIKEIKWIPCCRKKPESYPCKLELYVRDAKFCSPKEVKHFQFVNIIGTMKPLVDVFQSKSKVSMFYEWNSEPDVELVIGQLEKMMQVYSKNDNSKYISMSRDIFGFLNQQRKKGLLDISRLQTLNCVPTDIYGFKSAKTVVLKMHCSELKYSLKLEPYIFQLSQELTCYHELFNEIGVKSMVDFEMLESVLIQIRDRYHTTTDRNADNFEIMQDRKFTVDILTHIVSMDIDKDLMMGLYVPVMSDDDSLVFDCVKNCTFSEDVRNLNEDTGIVFVHPDISEVASMLGITSLTKRTLEKSTVFIPWGQKEPLTTTIANELESYADGFSIPKELLQNADDAKAKRIGFLYDERENKDLQAKLFDKGMAECQGQALWVYNDAMFQQKDFVNILNIGGKTKLMDNDKIGKFGLGFSSVYNITDVPSFISGDTLVVLDPHLNHLGDAVQNNEPGVRVKITKDIMTIYKNQFKPFEGIFGCKLDTDEFNFKGTLFRFPLRTYTQATRSKIKSTEYRKREMIELLHKLISGAANLLLFTQNVTELVVYHLDGKSSNPELDQQLLYKVAKSNVGSDDEPFLQTVVARNHLHEVSKQISRIQTIDIKFNLIDKIQLLSTHLKPFSGKQSWIVSWDTGKTSFDLEKRLRKNGAVTIGSVAIPVDSQGKILQLSKVPEGFYSVSHLFCFLPLPQQTSLPLHINGCFMTARDRRCIVTYNEDDILNENWQWNDALLTDVVQNAYINLASFITSNSLFSNVLEGYWEAWPLSTENDRTISHLVTSFYKNVLERDPVVFYRKTKDTVISCSFSHMLFLEPTFRNVQTIGQIAFESLINFYQGPETVIDMPVEVFKMFDMANKKIHEKLISTDKFYETYFFPHMADNYWKSPSRYTQRDILLKFALENQTLHELIKTNECIPVKHSETLRKPSDLVSQTGSVSTMFDINDQCFLRKDFEAYTSTLGEMGMMVDIVTSKVLLERACSLQTAKNLDLNKALQRSSSIIKYLNNTIENHQDVTSSLKKIPFLPVMSKPEGWPSIIPWKNDTLERDKRFLPPEDLFLSEDRFLISAIGFICGHNDHTKVLQLIGIRVVETKDVIEQLKAIGSLNIGINYEIKEMCSRIYSYINKHLGNYPDNLVKRELKRLQNTNIVFIKDKMVSPSQVSINLESDCDPYLFEIDPIFREYAALWNNMGIPTYFDLDTFLNVLKERSNQLMDTKMWTADVKSIVNILKNICSLLKREKRELERTEKDQIFIPDTQCILRSIENICFDDEYKGVLFGENQLNCIHHFVQNEFGIVETLGIKPKRTLHLSRYSNVLPFGQKEKLVARIRGIISAYPRDHSILNELLQNADDAGATEVHFVLDMRHHRTQHVFNDSWKKFQGPALTVFNNSCFSETDLDKIQELGHGSKSDDPTKTGQFGIGFNAVYHLTDVPSFLTRGPNTPEGSTFCVFDPHCTNVLMVDQNSTGLRFNNVNILQQSYQDVYNTYLQNELVSDEGTWFRFPLRTKDMAEKSEICDTIVDENSVKKMFLTMNSNMKKSLLFLTNVRKISLSYIEKDGTKLSGTEYAFLQMNSEDSQRKHNFVHNSNFQLKSLQDEKLDLRKFKYMEVRYNVNLHDITGYVERWLIVEAFGFPDIKDVPAEVVKAFNGKEIMLSPKGGAATCIESYNRETKDKKYFDMENGRAFCFLPLPIPTGLPVHINGHFALSSNRTQIFGGLFKDDIRYMWNRCIVDQTLAYAYAGLLKFYQQKIENCTHRHAVKKFFDCFPVFLFAKEDIWKDLTFSTYKSIIRQELNIFPVSPSFKKHECSIHQLSQQLEQNRNFKIKKWVPLQSTHGMFPAFFDNLHFGTTFLDDIKASEGTTRSTRRCSFYGEQNLREVLIDLGMNIICVPIGISKSINQSCLRRVHIREPYTEHKKNKMNIALSEKEIENIDENQRKHCICSKSVTPTVVIDFLKSWNSRASDKCVISVSSGPLLDDTLVRDIGRLMSVLEFCLMGIIKSIDELEGVPLLVRNDNSLTAFCTENNLILSKYCELFPRSADKFVHTCVWPKLVAFEKSFKQLEIISFSELLPYTLERSIYENLEPIEWISSENKLDEKWLSLLWEFLNTQDHIINVLKNWCLLPCLWFNEENKLVSFQMAYCLFHEERVEVSKDNLNKIMIKLKIPSPNTEICGTKHLSDIVATVFKPTKFVDCLHFHRKSVLWKNLTSDECDQLLTFFSNSTDSLGFLTLLKIKTLFLFTTVSENIVKLNDAQKVLVVKSSDCMTVFDGIDDLCIAKKTILIKHNSSHEKLYGKIGCILCYETKKKKNKSSKFKHPLLALYKQFLLPNFSHLNPEAHIPHLTFIRDELLRFEEIKVELPNMEFVPAESTSRYQKACDFYSPHNSLLRELCDDSELPSAPFSEIDWKEFMEYAGMKSTISLQMVINFAKTIQQNGNSPCSERQSELLIEHLFSLSNLEKDTYLLSTISQINFITPCTISDKYRSICSPVSDERLISFKDSIPQGYIDLCWTMEVLLPEYAVPTNDLILKHLNVKEQPDLKCVVSHIHKVCESFQRSGIQKENKSFIKELMEIFYKYLSKLPEHSMMEAKVMLGQTAMIFFVEYGQFLQASSVVVNLPRNYQIPPYLLKCSDCYGEYFDLFKILGATENVSIHQYSNILATMKNKAQEKPLTVQELKSFECAFVGLLYCLENYTQKDADKDSKMHLFLLNEKNVLKLASHLTINDRNLFRSRIGNVRQIDFMCDLTPLILDGFNPVARLLRLSENNRPNTITQSVKEKVVSTDSITSSDVAAKLERFLSGDLFSYAILRLMKTFQVKKNMKISESEFKLVTDQLKKLRVRALVTLKTVLLYKKEECKGSIRNKPVFYAQDENVMYVEYQKNLTESWLSRNIIWISDGIQEIAFKKIYISDIQAIMPFIELSRTELEEELNKLGFVDADYKFEGISWFPLPGTPVPEELLGFLSSEFCSFEAGDCAVYEVFDNTGDDIDDVVSVYIYVKIVEQLKDDLETFPLYVINTGEDVELKIRSHRLYNVIRPELNTSADIQLYTRSQVEQTIDQKEQIFQTVEIFLVHAWRLGPDEFKNVVRRLVLKWHPDKNENSSFCGEVFKHLTNFATRLQSGEIDVSKIDVRRNYENGKWEEYLRNATCSGDDVDGASKGYTFDIHGFANRVGTKRPRDCQHHGSSFQNPQPHMGRIWIKQARFDMSAAQLSLTTATERTYNWVCVQSHQAAEKALKAVQIVEDSSQVGNDHFLTKYITFRNPTLRDASKKLENLVVNYSRMRYPRITSYPLAPSEMYTKEQAEESVRLAAVIVDAVEDQFF